MLMRWDVTNTDHKWELLSNMGQLTFDIEHSVTVHIARKFFPRYLNKHANFG